MALVDIQQKQRSSGGKGGLFGKLAGGIVGAVGGAIIGGPAGASMGSSFGSNIGGAIGGAADPGKTTAPASVGLMSTAKRDPEVQLATLMDTQKEIAMTPDLDQGQKDEAAGLVNNAMSQLQKNLEIGRGRGTSAYT